ncbi:hypothetical protein [Amycolatopsis keratiniphila]|uniref:hypothetical protein n=1 Tax=Amycolatopsis keratiniphila TaxID=129921 RepID=UPI000F509C77|nr:hypothetical protein [Amycolatopsis keratiniphila]
MSRNNGTFPLHGLSKLDEFELLEIAQEYEFSGVAVDILRGADGIQALPVIEALGKFEAQEAASVIVALLDHSFEPGRAAAARTCGSNTNGSLGADIRQYRSWR